MIDRPYPGLISSLSELAVFLSGSSVVAVDGKDGSGKTFTARYLSKELRGAPIDFDDFVDRDCGFLAGLRLDELRNAIEFAARPLFLSGVCMMDVLDRLAVQVDAVVYVKRMAGSLWRDEDELFGDALEAYDRAGYPAYPLDYEIREYHRRRRPHEHATFTFMRQG